MDEIERAVQVAGVHDLAEAELVVEAGADFLGLPLRLPDGREDVSEADAARICAAVGDRVETVLITYLTDARAIARFADDLACGWVQLHGRIAPNAVAQLRDLRPELRLIGALVVGPGDLSYGRGPVFSDLEALEPYVDAFITDTYDPATGRRGATGRVHDWRVSRALVERTSRPVILAGGLTPENVAEAVARVGPAAVDAHTGVEGADGRKDANRVAAFAAAARAAFAAGGADTDRGGPG